jgi:hypothetical protein
MKAPPTSCAQYVEALAAAASAAVAVLAATLGSFGLTGRAAGTAAAGT